MMTVFNCFQSIYFHFADGFFFRWTGSGSAFDISNGLFALIKFHYREIIVDDSLQINRVVIREDLSVTIFLHI